MPPLVAFATSIASLLNRSAAARVSRERDSQVRGARGARVERINPLAHRLTSPRRFQRAHPRWRARTPSCRTFVWKKAVVQQKSEIDCEASLKLKFFTLKTFLKSAVFFSDLTRTYGTMRHPNLVSRNSLPGSGLYGTWLRCLIVPYVRVRSEKQRFSVSPGEGLVFR